MDGLKDVNELLRRFDACVNPIARQLLFGESVLGVEMVDRTTVVLGWDAIPRLYSFCWNNLKRLRGVVGGDIVLRLSLVVMCISPANYTNLNLRKEALVSDTSHLLLLRELNLVSFVQSKHVKEGDLFAHRQFVLQLLMTKSVVSDGVWLNEIELCERCVAAHPRNYLAWKHRLFVIDMKKEDKTFVSEEGKRAKSADPSSVSYLRCVERYLSE
jgi:hypothetical protein